MKKPVLAGLVFLSFETTYAAASDSVERKPLTIGTKIETGQIVNGEPVDGADPEDFYISQIGVNLTQQVIVNRRLDIKIGAGEVFYTSFPSLPLGTSGSQGIKFGPGISQAQAYYKFGEPEQSWGGLRVGYFPYKYNPDAKNLGEYLFRSGAYPTFIFTGGWAIMDNAQVKAQGIEFNFWNLDGALKHSFLLTSERDFRPVGDFTPSYLAEYTKGAVQIGGGVSLYHYLPIKPSAESPKGSDNVVYAFDNLPAFKALNPLTGDSVQFKAGQHILAGYGDAANIISPAINPSSRYSNGSTDSIVANYHPSTTYYTFKAIKLMARASISFQKITHMDFLGAEDLKLYAETALLGVQNYDGLYEKPMERMPVMVGFNLPAFKLLDILSFEVEYLNSSNPDDFGMQQTLNRPSYSSNYPSVNTQSDVSGMGSGRNATGGYTLMFRDPSANHRDDWKWSVYAVRQLTSGFSVRAQVANDHFRPQDTYFANYWTGPSLMRNPKDWYYIVSLNFGI